MMSKRKKAYLGQLLFKEKQIKSECVNNFLWTRKQEMNLFIKNRIVSFILLISALIVLPASAEDCPRGSLGKQFCDRDGDMQADAPTDPSKFISPYTLVFGTNPIHSFIFYEEAKNSFIKHMEKVTGKHVVFFPYQTNAAQLEAMDAGMLHIAGLTTGSVPTAINCSGFHLAAMRAKKNGEYGYRMEIITYPESNIKKMSDLKDEVVLFVSPSSNSGYKAPVALLKQRFNLEKTADYKVRFSGKHSKSISKIANKEYKVAAVANGIAESMMAQKKIPKDSVISIYRSESFPTTGYGYAHNLDPELAKKIETAFKTFEWRNSPDTPLKPLNKYNDVKFIDADYKNKWEIIRTIDKATNVSYDCNNN